MKGKIVELLEKDFLKQNEVLKKIELVYAEARTLDAKFLH
jgi:hypothetical protein